MYLPLVDLQRKIFFIYILVHSDDMSVISVACKRHDFTYGFCVLRENNYLLSFRVFSYQISYSKL